MDNSITKVEVAEVIRLRYKDALPAAKKVMDYIVRHPQNIVNYTVAELAASCGTSVASIVRVCHWLGYDGYTQLKTYLARDLGKRDMSLKNRELGSAVAESMEELLNSIRAMRQIIDEDAIREGVRCIKNASCVHVVAAGNTANLSQYIGFRLERSGIKSNYYREPVYILNKISFADSKEIILAISKSGNTSSVLDAVNLAKEREMKVIAITANGGSELASMADVLLLSGEAKRLGGVHKSYSYFEEFVIAEVILDLIINDEVE